MVKEFCQNFAKRNLLMNKMYCGVGKSMHIALCNYKAKQRLLRNHTWSRLNTQGDSSPMRTSCMWICGSDCVWLYVDSSDKTRVQSSVSGLLFIETGGLACIYPAHHLKSMNRTFYKTCFV